MQTDWKDFLVQQGARFENDTVIDFTKSETAQNGNTVTPLTDISILKISGDDANTFLNAQFTTDISKLKEDNVQLSAWCNPKGRVISNFFIFLKEAKYYLFLPTELKEKFCKRLQMYVFRAAVSIEDIDEGLICLGLCGDNIESLTIQQDVFSFNVVDQDRQRAIVFGTSKALQDFWKAINTTNSPTETQYWQLLNNLAGIPWITTHSSEEYLPQELNLDLIGGLSFNKGCYPGQEIVARVHYRGQVKRRTVLATTSLDNKLEVGSKLYIPEQERPIGTVLNTNGHPDNHYLPLCVIDNDQLNAKKVHLGSTDGPTVELQNLPYQINIS